MLKSQNEQILQRLKAGPMTALDALEHCGCFRLSARIYDLRSEGHVIASEIIKVNDKRVAQYRLLRRST